LIPCYEPVCAPTRERGVHAGGVELDGSIGAEAGTVRAGNQHGLLQGFREQPQVARIDVGSKPRRHQIGLRNPVPAFMVSKDLHRGMRGQVELSVYLTLRWRGLPCVFPRRDWSREGCRSGRELTHGLRRDRRCRRRRKAGGDRTMHGALTVQVEIFQPVRAGGIGLGVDPA